MPRVHQVTFPALTRQLVELGERLRLARLRRNLTAISFAERLGVSRDTLNRLEHGDPAIAIGTYAKALRILGLDQDIDRIASEDPLGRKLQDLAISGNKKARRAPVRKAIGRTETAMVESAAASGQGGMGDEDRPAATSQKNRTFLAALLKRKTGAGNGEG